MEDLSIYLIIIFISIVQSIFGVGILLFGTPTFIYLNYDFFETLNILLPCSLIVSLIQIFNTKKNVKKNKKIFKKNFFIYCLSVIFISLILLSKYADKIDFGQIVGITLIIILLTKLFSKLRKNFNFFINKNQKIINLLIGFIHGTTNMGGSFLSIYVNEITKDDIKLKTYLIGYAYFFMASTQLLSLILTGNLYLTKVNIVCIILTIFSVIFTSRVIKNIRPYEYNLIFNSILLVYAFLLLVFK